ncbi:YitT family protein [Paenibacillus aurantius]|uniref:YitT family protein n=1 Tax=Paenibacillus aurantius TaxID=2918900 RepID=A0AA96L913_9BACL|nr:YitT family protein [Paenibacillus aurantius]WNQ09261.1 YitT family protein [Paenibacillus aurantius]
MPLWKQAVLFRQILPIMLGTAIYAFGLHYFVISNELMEGGVTGVALLLNYAFGMPPSLTNLILNVPLFLIGLKIFGKRPMFYTLLGILSLSFFLWVMEVLIRKEWVVPFRAPHDYFLATLYAGVTLGAGLGLVFRFGGTTGGADIVARLGSKWFGWSMGQVILALDVIVIGTSLIYIPKEKVLYTLVAVFIASKVIDFITEGSYAAKAFTIISDHGQEIADRISVELDRGITMFPAKGAYSKAPKDVVYCVVYRDEVRRLKGVVQSVDPRAFMIITDVHDVLGEGFRTD